MTQMTAPAASSLRTPEGLRAWRSSHSLNQSEVGELLEVTNVTVSRWELGLVPIPRTVELALRYLEIIYAGRDALRS